MFSTALSTTMMTMSTMSITLTNDFDPHTMYDSNDFNSFETTRKNKNNNTQMMVTFSNPLFWGVGVGGR